MATDATVAATLKADQTWLQAHERLIIVTLVLLVGGWLGNKYLDNKATEAKTVYGIAQQASDAAKSAADVAGKQYAATIAALTQQNQSLAQTIAQRQTVTQTKVKDVLDPKPITDVLEDIQVAYPKTEIDFDGTTITPTGQLAFPLPTVQKFTATKIERDADEATIADQGVVITNQKTELDKGDTLVASLNQVITKSDETCKAQVASVKTSANKSKKTWFVIGFVAGIGTRILAHW